MSDKKITVLIVDDSPSARELLTYIINGSPNLEVIGCVENGEKALQFLKFRRPDVITMDIVMPKLDGFETTRRIMSTKPIPIIVISSSYLPEDVEKSFQAMEAGSLAILEKPKGPLDPQFPLVSKNIIDTISNMADVKLVTRRAIPKPVVSHPSLPPIHQKKVEAIAIGASLGGPQALQTILSQLPGNFPVPIFIVQHISRGFIKGLVDWLGSSTKLQVKLGEDGYIAKPGEVIIAPDQYHLEVGKSNVIHLVKPDPKESLYPSVARLFHSMADAHGPHGACVILTGMGRDGVNDLLYVKEKMGITIAQDEVGCTMFGMPKEAIACGAAKHVIRLENMHLFLQTLVRSNSPL